MPLRERTVNGSPGASDAGLLRSPVMSPALAPTTPTHAWVRLPDDAYAQCLRMEQGGAPDVERARQEHRGYVQALREAGIAVEIVPPADGLADACFVEDAAVILDHAVAVMTRPGAPSRRPEVETLVPVLAEAFELRRMTGPATLDGGDVMRAGSRLFVGRSSRTNDEGIEQLRGFARGRGLEVHALDVARGLHLKSACTVLDDRTAVVDPGALDPAVLEHAGFAVHRVEEPAGANVLAFGDRVLVSAAASSTAAWLRSTGRVVVEIALDEFHRGDGALSCLSLRRPAPGAWSV